MATQKIPNWKMPTLKPLETRWNEAESCFEVDWEESVRRQAIESLANAMREKIEGMESTFYYSFLRNK